MGDRTYSDSILIRAEPEAVFAHFVDPLLLARWIGDEALVDAKPGGRFTLRFGDRRVEGRYIEIESPNRVVISWGRAGSATFPPESSVLPAEYERHELGWRHYLGRLAEATTGTTTNPHNTPESLTRGAD